MTVERVADRSVIELRKFVLADIGLLTAWIDGPEELMTWAPVFSWPLEESRLAEYVAESETPGRRIWTAVDSGSGEAVGHVSLKPDEDGRNARLGRVLVSPSARGRGYGAAMLREVLALAFGPLGLHRVELGVFTHNGSAIRLYERLGFVCDTVLHDVERVNGHSWSAMQMSITKPATTGRHPS
jgi:RimJ/RimL family protein N-acetyltransferase